MLKLAVVIFAIVAVAHAGYAVIDTYPDMNCNTTVVARFISTAPDACVQITKRGAQQAGGCTSTGSVNFIIDYTNCAATAEPELPTGWQGVQITPESTCNVTASASVNATSYLGAPTPFTNTLIQIFSPQLGFIAANTTLSCAANGVQSVSTCVDTSGVGGPGVVCSALTLQTGVCSGDANNQNYGLQQTCLAPPTAPVAAPAAGPTSTTPAASPVKTPVKAPAKASSASALCGSVALLALAALF